MDESNDIVRELMENFKKLTVSTTSKVKPRQGKQKKIIWTGTIEWQEKAKGAKQGQRSFVTESAVCRVYTKPGSKEIIDVDKWPNKVTMQTMPVSAVVIPLKKFLCASKIVVFRIAEEDVKSMMKIYNILVNGLAGVVHFPALVHYNIRIMVVLPCPQTSEIWGLIPDEQHGFVKAMRDVITKMRDLQAKRSQQTQQQPAKTSK